ncbi:hypothetical protein CAPTEDRAFT_153615 [Capitella teleta]|uniref:Fibrinogen C-terminal domain-containing protein n=1 Tax=Capitella teleta TaxID=283909 RepID=R7V5T6_CAPTE|nr:hypothetical protein CAPTEDRAFT_153615 [Capitella teleta]|eukprot:ELU13842.1 hypothetical protein CAPTEDRAFT_153615 [Capitella teleta]
MEVLKFLLCVVLVVLCKGQKISRRASKIGLHQTKLRHHAPCENNTVECVEQRILHEVHKAEDRLGHRLDTKVKRLNQTLHIVHLERMLHFVNEELHLAKQGDVDKERLLLNLQRTLAQQQANVDALQSDVQRLTKQLLALTGGQEKVTQAPMTTERTNDLPELQPIQPKDCQATFDDGDVVQRPGHYYMLIQPMSSPRPFQACCKITNTSGWTLIQRRQDGSVDFFRTWKEYKQGFGNLEGEFWLGNDRIHELTSQGDYRLRLELTTWDGDRHWAEYDHFSVEDEIGLYRIHVNGYHGDAGDSLTSSFANHDGQAFSTKDVDNDERFYDSCARHYKGAWWFKNCFESHLNGVYYQRGDHDNFFVRDGVQWNTIHLHSSLKHVEMMVRPNERNSVA